MKRDLRARHVMTAAVLTVRADDDIREVARLFTEERISGAPVVDADGRPVGVISQADLVRYPGAPPPAAASGAEYYRTPLPGEDPVGMPVERFPPVRAGDIMTPIVVDAPEDAPVSHLAALMLDLRIHRIIITRDRRLAGIVTSTDLLGLLRDPVDAH
jgi:CBS domain-containing protein